MNSIRYGALLPAALMRGAPARRGCRGRCRSPAAPRPSPSLATRFAHFPSRRLPVSGTRRNLARRGQRTIARRRTPTRSSGSVVAWRTSVAYVNRSTSTPVASRSIPTTRGSIAIAGTATSRCATFAARLPTSSVRRSSSRESPLWWNPTASRTRATRPSVRCTRTSRITWASRTIRTATTRARSRVPKGGCRGEER